MFNLIIICIENCLFLVTLYSFIFVGNTNQYRKWVNNSFALMPMPIVYIHRQLNANKARRNKKQKKWNELYLWGNLNLTWCSVLNLFCVLREILWGYSSYQIWEKEKWKISRISNHNNNFIICSCSCVPFYKK